MSTSWSLAVRNADLDTIRGPRLNNGYIRIYDGVRPASVDTPIGAHNLLATLRFSATAFPAAVAGVITANPITGGRGELVPSGDATWARCYESDGATAVCDVDCGVSGDPGPPDMILDNTLIPFNVMVNCTSFTVTELS